MTGLKIIKYGNPILRKKAEKIEEITEDIRRTVKDMEEIMKAEKGIGLSAPQIGLGKRLIIVNSGEKIIHFINPIIKEKNKDKEIKEEGCLSFPGLFLRIKRPNKVKVEAVNLDNHLFQLEAEGLLARIIQHEIDHLDGILFIDRIGFWERWKIRKKLKELLC